MSNLFYLEHPSNGAKNTNIAQTSTTTITTSPQHEKKTTNPNPQSLSSIQTKQNHQSQTK